MHKHLISALFVLGLTACQSESGTQQPPATSTNGPAASHNAVAPSEPPAANSVASQRISAETRAMAAEHYNPVVAKIQGMPIQQSMLDESIALKLNDLEWARYELRRAALSHLVEDALSTGRIAGGEVEVLLQPPTPPRLQVSDAQQPALGSANAPITVSIFCSYQSSHCGRMQANYDALATRYGEQIRFVFYDFPQAFHKQGPEASFAARCAAEMGQFEGFHKALWAQQQNLGMPLYLRLAKQLQLDEAAFQSCIEQRKHLELVKDNMQLAEGFGFGNVPVTLVNGLYLKGPKSVDTLRYFVDAELARLGIGNMSDQHIATNQSLPQSTLPLRLEGVLLSDAGDASVAMIRDIASGHLAEFRQDDALSDAVFLVLVEQDRVIIENAGTLETLPLVQSAQTAQTTQADATTNAAGEALASGQSDMSAATGPDDHAADAVAADVPEEIRMAAEAQGFTPRNIVAAQGETPLSRAWLDEQLQKSGALQDHFEPGELEVEGVHVLKLKGVESSEFYQTLGLQEGDVVLRVNNEWVHEAQNNLFAQLDSANEVSVVLMRRGLPVHLKYAIN